MSICRIGHTHMHEKIKMKKEFIIREYEKSDYKQVNNLWKQCNLLEDFFDDTPELIERTLKNGGIFYVMEHNDKIVGTSWITTDYREMYLHRFAISPNFQGKGLSKKLLIETMKFVRKINLPLRLEVHEDNIPARKLYEKYNFEIFDNYMVMMIHKQN